MYFLNSSGTLYHILEDIRTGEAPDPCGAKVKQYELARYQEGKPSRILSDKPKDIPFCKHCEKLWRR